MSNIFIYLCLVCFQQSIKDGAIARQYRYINVKLGFLVVLHFIPVRVTVEFPVQYFLNTRIQIFDPQSTWLRFGQTLISYRCLFFSSVTSPRTVIICTNNPSFYYISRIRPGNIAFMHLRAQRAELVHCRTCSPISFKAICVTQDAYDV